MTKRQLRRLIDVLPALLIVFGGIWFWVHFTFYRNPFLSTNSFDAALTVFGSFIGIGMFLFGLHRVIKAMTAE